MKGWMDCKAQDAQAFRKRAGKRALTILLGMLTIAALGAGCSSPKTPEPSAGLEPAAGQAGDGRYGKMAAKSNEPTVVQDDMAADQSLTVTTYPPNGKANFLSEKGGFEIFFPSEPKRAVKDQRNIVGEFFTVQHQGAHYYAGYFVHPYRGLDKLILKRSIGRVVDKVGGGSLEAENISFHGKLGSEFLIQGGTDGVMVHGRYYCFGNRVYLTRYSAPISQFQEDEAQLFLDSFNPSPILRTASWLYK